ncbi:MAG: hypothetical protein Crog4KO_01610 [Crocinitomicaceae bacterium]
MKTKINLIFGLAIGAASLLILPSCSAEKTDEQPKIVSEEVNSEPSYFLFISDIHLNTEGTDPSEYGQDTRLDLWDMLKVKLVEITNGDNPPAFIVYTGDLPDHNPDTGDLHDANIRTVLNELLEVAGNIPLFYAPGNNDPRGGDYFPYSDSTCTTPLDLARKNSGYPAPNSKEIYNYNPSYGYYSAGMYNDLKVIGLNTVMFSVSHSDDYHPHCSVDTLNQQEESLKQLAWLRGELEAAEMNNEHVYMIMHIPPGDDAYKGVGMWKNAAWQVSLLAFSEEFEPLISGMFFGHTHMDEIRRLSKPSNPKEYSVVAISAPGVSPIFKNNPGFKKVYINDDYYATDFTTHYTSKINNVWGVNGTSWGDSTYTFSEIYGSGTTIKETISKMPLETLFDKMMEIYMVKSGYTSGSSYIKEGIEVE